VLFTHSASTGGGTQALEQDFCSWHQAPYFKEAQIMESHSAELSTNSQPQPPIMGECAFGRFQTQLMLTGAEMSCPHHTLPKLYFHANDMKMINTSVLSHYVRGGLLCMQSR
jgi:hypothetical protein